jgi:Raf kinase inhibitor-like YbhB/YbcL family protein
MPLNSVPPHARSMRLTSASIADGRIQRVHAARSHGGEDQTPGLTVHGFPDEAHYLSVVADDPDAMGPTGRVWVHWNMFNVPHRGESVDLRPGQPMDGTPGITTGGRSGYEGMAPPDGEHTYRFAVFASAEPIQADTTRPWTVEDFERAYGNKTLRVALIEGRFGPVRPA